MCSDFVPRQHGQAAGVVLSMPPTSGPNPPSWRPLSMNIYENGTSSLYNIEIQHGTAAVLLLTVNSDVG